MRAAQHEPGTEGTKARSADRSNDVRVPEPDPTTKAIHEELVVIRQLLQGLVVGLGALLAAALVVAVVASLM